MVEFRQEKEKVKCDSLPGHFGFCQNIISSFFTRCSLNKKLATPKKQKIK